MLPDPESMATTATFVIDCDGPPRGPNQQEGGRSPDIDGCEGHDGIVGPHCQTGDLLSCIQGRYHEPA